MNRTTALIVMLVLSSLSALFGYRAGYTRGSNMARPALAVPDAETQQDRRHIAQKSLSEKQGVPTTTTKEIETFGKDLLGKPVQMICSFTEVDDSWVRLLLHDDDYVGVMVSDQNGDLFQYVFADKATYGRDLLKLKRGDKIRLVGKIKQVKTTFVLIAEEISW